MTLWTTLWHALQGSELSQLPLAAALAGLFALALLSATLLPLGSEAALLAVAATHDSALGWVWLAATAGNTLGGLVTYAMGRGAHRLAGAAPPRTGAPPPGMGRTQRTAQRWVQGHGAWVCVLAWLPVIGDALCAAAGWLRLPVAPCALAMALGKGARYALLLVWVA